MNKPPNVTDLTNFRSKRQRDKYDKDLNESGKAISVIDPPPHHALHKAITQKTQRSIAAELRLSKSAAYHTHTRKMEGLEDYRFWEPPEYTSPPPPPKPKVKPLSKKQALKNKMRNAFDDVLRASTEKKYDEGKLTRKKDWHEGIGWTWIYTATPEYMKELGEDG